MKPTQSLNGILNGLADFNAAEAIFEEGENSGRYVTVAAARLADDMAEAFAEGGAGKGAFSMLLGNDEKGTRARMLASFGAMACELRRLQDQSEEQRRSLALTEAAERRRVELVAELQSVRELMDSLAYDIGELPARFVAGDVPAAASIIAALPKLRDAIRDADSVLGDN